MIILAEHNHTSGGGLSFECVANAATLGLVTKSMSPLAFVKRFA